MPKDLNSFKSIFPNKREKVKKKKNCFRLILKYFVEKEGIMSQDILWVFLLSVLSSSNDTNLATNTNILLLLLLGLSNNNNNNNVNYQGCRCFNNLI